MLAKPCPLQTAKAHLWPSTLRMKRVRNNFNDALYRCSEKRATLFVPNSYEEWNAIRKASPKAQLSWVGLARFAVNEKFEELPRWQTGGAVNAAEINWLIKPYNPLSNGYTWLANCVAHYNGLVEFESSSYTFYYPCSSKFESICK